MEHLALDFIVIDPDIRGGLPIIDGTTIRVIDVVALTIYHGRSPEAISVSYSLSLAQVYAALTYYHAHKEACDDALAREDALFEEAEAKQLGKRHSILS
ncbi:MAG: DUF433 domain-containing protein [bacterium]|nr:DUF433 domain-containing protein [bacterium]